MKELGQKLVKSRRERNAKYYNKRWRINATKREEPLAEVGYLDLYETIVSFLPEDKSTKILDLGCGIGNIAELIYNKGYKNYIGVDFSKVAIERARRRVPQVEFIVANVFSKKVFNLIKSISHFIALEFLEHIKEDLKLLRTIPGGSQVIFLAPTFDYVSHVRYFVNVEQIINRYHDILEFSSGDIVRKMKMDGLGEVSSFMVNSTRRFDA